MKRIKEYEGTMELKDSGQVPLFLYMEFEKIREILVEQFGVDESSITPDTAFVDDLGADSLDVVELIMAIEEAFDMEIPDGEAENIETVKDAVEYLKNNN